MPDARTVEAARADDMRREIPDSLLPGLYLVISHLTGAKSWCVRYRFHGTSRKHTLGSYPALGLKDARELAAKALRAVAEGRDPGREKVEARSARVDSFDSVMDEFLDRHVRRLNRARTAEATEGALRRYALPYWRGRLIGDISRRDVISLLDEIVVETPITANRTLSAVRKMFAWAMERDIVATSPCAGVKPPAPEKARDRVLSDAELSEVWRAADELGYPFGAMTKMLVLTGQRRNEVAHMTWNELDLDKHLWVLPPERTKNNQRHAGTTYLAPIIGRTRGATAS